MIPDVPAASHASESVSLSEFTHLYEMSLRLASTRDLHPLFEAILSIVTEHQGTDLAAVLRYDPVRQELAVVASKGFSRADLECVGRVPVGAKGWGGAVTWHRAMLIQDVESDPRGQPFRDAARLGGYRALALVPVKGRRGQLLGALATYFRAPHTPTVEGMRLVELCAREVGQAMEHAGADQDHEVAARKRAEAALLTSETLLRTILETELDCVKLLGPGGVLQLINRAGLVILEADRVEEVLGRCVYPLVAREHQEAFQALVEAALAGASGKLEFQLTSLKGTRRWMETTIVPLRQGGRQRQAALAITRDITDRKQAEQEIRRLLHEAEAHQREWQEKQEQLIQAGKLATLGELAAGIAHELNNPLNNIGLFLGNVLDVLHGRSKTSRPREALIEALELARAQVHRAAAIIKHLRTLGCSSPRPQEPVNLHVVLTEALAMLQEQLRLRGIRLTLDLARSEPMVLGQALQLEQVFLNLLTNARDAVEQAACKAITIRTAIHGEVVEVVVEDTGPGIPAGYEQRIFDPFFTTKEVGKGSGLGLSLAYSIIKAHQGTITVSNRPTAGAQVSIRLPLLQAQPSA